MEAKVAALETEVINLRTTLVTMQEQAESNQARLLDLLTQRLSKQSVERDESGSVLNNNATPSRSGTEQGGPSFVSGWARLDGGLLDEFRKSAKKVELPLFNGDDPAGWIA